MRVNSKLVIVLQVAAVCFVKNLMRCDSEDNKDQRNYSLQVKDIEM